MRNLVRFVIAVSIGYAVMLVIGLSVFSAQADETGIAPAPIDGRMRNVCATPTAPADLCTDRGWIIKPRVHLGPSGFVRWLSDDVPPCPAYDGTNNETGVRCFWDQPLMAPEGQLGESYVWIGRFFIITPGYRCGAVTCPTHHAVEVGP